MALIRRVARLITADVHSLLDQLEEPRAVLRQSIREMDDRLARLEGHHRQRLVAVEAADRRIASLETSLRDIDGKLDLCLADGDATLARRLVRRKLETKRLIDSIRATRDGLADEHAELAALAARQRDELERMRQKAALFIEPDCEPERADEHRFAGIDDADVEIALIAEKQARQPL